VLKLLEPAPDELVLEVACGNGAFARRLAGLGVRVLACDFSAGLLERARERGDLDGRIEYRQVDATSAAQLLALGEGRFDAATSNMALMDIPTIEPLVAALARLLKPGGRFVFSTQHPCFNTSRAVKMVEQDDRDGVERTTYALKVSRYLTPFAERGIGIGGQPAAHYIFHRPLGVLLNAAFQAGFVLDGLDEPMHPGAHEEGRWWAWPNFRELPPALVARVRLRS
jgi:SAM-dependent methyltransferase